MANNHRSLSLPNLLNLDALACSFMGVCLIAVSAPIGAWTALPAPLLFWAGILLLPIAAFMAASARSVPVPSWAANFVILGNCAWVIVSLALPLAGLVSPNPIGWLLLGGQAGLVATLAVAEFGASNRPIPSTQGSI
ncbi:hypothetical protein [Devosia sp. SD17-2]|uniref:hypothetical protein n=1 Tax=Devosia sp. SD17-2 TaxID=2976459 RepID=UPI0023D811BA|nr:hypothetical protein [Devosia sp. SD17-2]WEJ35062.1 hypothetical protein NYQ88_09835 [Devosia sp. SD17-2]